MSDLQLSLLVIGAMIVGAVLVYNWVQERTFRRRLKQAFGEAPEDILLRREQETAAQEEARVEPQLQHAPNAVRMARLPQETRTPDTASTRAAAVPGTRLDPALDYVAEIALETPIPAAAAEELLSKIAGCGRPTRVLGFNPEREDWEELVRRGRGGYLRLRLGMQLVNRSGTVNPAQLAMFCDAVRGCAEKLSGRAACPDTQEALRTARELDVFCAGVDVAVGVNVIAEEGNTFAGTRIRALAEAAGFKLEPDGVFHYRNERRQTLFTLDNHEPAPFLPERLKSLTTRGVTLMLDVPRVEDGLGVLDRMLVIGHDLAAALDGKVVDDNRVGLTDAGITTIREQLRSIHIAMAAREMPAGGERALRLFS